MGENKWFICSYQVYKNLEFLNIMLWFLYLEHGIKSYLTPAKYLNADTVFIARYYYYNGSSENTTPLQLLFTTLEALGGRGCCCCRSGSACSRLAGVRVWTSEHWEQEWVPVSLFLTFSFPFLSLYIFTGAPKYRILVNMYVLNPCEILDFFYKVV